MAAYGVLAEAYESSLAPGHTCPCLIFETSTDHGATFTRHIVSTVSGSSSPEVFLAADPKVKGLFALTILDSTGAENQVSGAAWQGPTLVGESPANIRFKPWITFGNSEDLALVWRRSTPAAPYDVWAALGHVPSSGDAVFGTPIRVSSGSAPYPSGYAAGVDLSWIITDAHHAHIGWGDSRNGPVQVWYGRLPSRHRRVDRDFSPTGREIGSLLRRPRLLHQTRPERQLRQVGTRRRSRDLPSGNWACQPSPYALRNARFPSVDVGFEGCG